MNKPFEPDVSVWAFIKYLFEPITNIFTEPRRRRKEAEAIAYVDAILRQHNARIPPTRLYPHEDVDAIVDAWEAEFSEAVENWENADEDFLRGVEEETEGKTISETFSHPTNLLGATRHKSKSGCVFAIKRNTLFIAVVYETGSATSTLRDRHGNIIHIDRKEVFKEERLQKLQ